MEHKYEEVFQEIWGLSPNISDSKTYVNLNRLTQELIKEYDAQGRLDNDPFLSTKARTLSQPFEKINSLLANSICLVTGGLGCVGSSLVNELLNFDVKQIVILDKNPNSSCRFESNPVVTVIYGDIRNQQTVHHIFTLYQPQFVFHVAAQRDPGYAELHVADTVTTNVLGTLNIVKACEYTGSVKQCIFSSTGKASRYFTEEIYAGSKKLCENILDVYSREGRVKYGMVRFTHMLENSLMNNQLKASSEHSSYVGVHSPGKYVTAQNKKEAASLMLNALLYSERNRSNFLVVRNLEWPVESLEVALYHVKKSGRNIPVVFLGNPSGYTEKFFRGQLDWSNPSELNLLINVFENKQRIFNKEEDIIISNICPSSKEIVDKVVCKIERVQGEMETKACLIEGLKDIVKNSLTKVSKKDTVEILNWGLQEKFLAIEKAKASDYGAMLPLMLESLEGSIYYNEVADLLRE